MLGNWQVIKEFLANRIKTVYNFAMCFKVKGRSFRQQEQLQYLDRIKKNKDIIIIAGKN
jgi:hypothetical protein